MAALYNDNSVNYGSVTITTVTGAVTYVCDNFTVNRPVKVIKRTNQLDEPTGSVGVADFAEGSAQLQFLTKFPANGDSFTITVDATAYGSETFRILNVDNPHDKGAERKVNITFIKTYA